MNNKLDNQGTIEHLAKKIQSTQSLLGSAMGKINILNQHSALGVNSAVSELLTHHANTYKPLRWIEDSGFSKITSQVEAIHKAWDVYNNSGLSKVSSQLTDVHKSLNLYNTIGLSQILKESTLSLFSEDFNRRYSDVTKSILKNFGALTNFPTNNFAMGLEAYTDYAESENESDFDDEESESPIITPEKFLSNSINIIKMILNNGLNIYKLTPRQFEELIAEIFYKDGYDVELTPQTRDGGKDIIVKRKSNLGLEDKYIIECKRYFTKKTVGIDIVQRIYGVKTDLQVNKAIVVTTSSFTPKAKEFALKHFHEVELKDYHNVIQWIKCNYAE